MGLGKLLGIEVSAPQASAPVIDPSVTPAGVLPPSRLAGSALTTGQAVTIPAVYRAIQIIATSLSQLVIDVERWGSRMDPLEHPAHIRRPSLTLSRSDWIEAWGISMAATGEGTIHAIRDRQDRINELEVWPTHEVHVDTDPHAGTVRYWRAGKAYPARDVQHCRFMQLPGQTRGLGPIQAARASLGGAVDLRDYIGRWWNDSGQPAGVLTSEQYLSADDATLYRRYWNGLNADGTPMEQIDNPSRIKVLGKGLSYEPILLSPTDALWLEAQSFTVLEVARLFGMPSSLMLAAVDGSSRTYANVEQEWTAYVRFTLMAYVRKLEEALTYFAPNGQTVRLRLEALLRADAKTRYEGYQLGINAGWLDPDEVRDLEHLDGPAPKPTKKDATA